MIIVIDGYNLLKHVLHAGKISQHERDLFIKKLVVYAKKKHHKIVLVFDAGPFYSSSIEDVGEVSVVYSGLQESADDWIRRYMQVNKQSNIVLVTFDRELKREARQRTIDTIEPVVFYEMVLSVMPKKKQITRDERQARLIKTTELQNDYLDILMQESSSLVPSAKNDEVYKQNRSIKSPQLSKNERKLLKKISKM